MNQRLGQRLMLTALAMVAVYLWFALQWRNDPEGPHAMLDKLVMAMTGTAAIACVILLAMRRRR